MSAKKPLQPQKIDWMACGTVQRQIGEYLADHRCEFEAVARKAGAENHVGVLRVRAENEMVVR